ncbi:MAG: hypothetical protein ACR2RL_21505 [Gammaproteobacteria bacterium]
MADNVHHLEVAEGSVEDALKRLGARQADTGLRFLAAVVIDASGEARCYQGGTCRTIEAIGLLATMQTRMELEALGLGDEDDE